MRKIITLIITIIMWGACGDFVNNVDHPKDQVPNDLLTDESQIPFLITGVQVRFATTHDQAVILSEGLSDVFFFDETVEEATFESLFDIDLGLITLDNNSVDGLFFDLGELRYLADDLVRRTNAIVFSDPELRQQALFTGYLFGAIARYFFATYFGLNETEGGGVIDNSRFVSSEEMYGQAIAGFERALANIPNAYEYGPENYPSDYLTRLVNSLLARTYLYKGDFAMAQLTAGNGLQPGDKPFQSLHSTKSDNEVWGNAGLGRSQYVVDDRFFAYLLADSNETARIPLNEILSFDSVDTFFIQVKYDEISSPINFMSWQENELILAELELSSNSTSALARINAIRASHGIDPLTVIDLSTLLIEREKELFAEGQRLPDQRRHGMFHLPQDRWQFLPITETERNNNPCLSNPGTPECEPPPLP